MDQLTVGRRHVAGLFAGLCGFAELAESAGPEPAVEQIAPVVDSKLCDLARPGMVWINPRTIELAGLDVGALVRMGNGGAEVDTGGGAQGSGGAGARATGHCQRAVQPADRRRLQISRHTAEAHLRHIFAKLNWRSLQSGT